MLKHNDKTIEERIKELEEIMKGHQHLGTDGSREFSGETFVNAKGIAIHGAGTLVKDFTALPFNIYDSQEGDEKKRRVAGVGIAATGTKDAFNEQTQLGLSVGKDLDKESVAPRNRTDWDKTSLSQLFLIHFPQYPSMAAGPSTFPPWSFLIASRSPDIPGTGTINGGASTLTDSSADFKTNVLAGSILFILPSLEARKIVSNTNNVITISGSWTVASGSYSYQVVTPIFLGAANYPFTRLFVGEDIRMGYGASGGTQVQYIKWGSGSPEGVVRANVGSLYLRSDGGAGTTLYIKETGTGNAGWTAK